MLGLRERHLDGDDRGLGPALEVLGDDGPHVEAVDLVGARHDDDLGARLTQLGTHLQQVVGVAGAEALGPAGLPFLRHEPPVAAAGAVEVPGPPTGEVAVERGRLVLHRDPHVRDAAVAEVAQCEVDELVAAGEGEGGLGALTREDVHPGALTTRLDDPDDLRDAGEGDDARHTQIRTHLMTSPRDSV